MIPAKWFVIACQTSENDVWKSNNLSNGTKLISQQTSVPRIGVDASQKHFIDCSVAVKIVFWTSKDTLRKSSVAFQMVKSTLWLCPSLKLGGSAVV
jgi:hypothetical protein